MKYNVPETLFSGYWGKCHCQGIAVDPVNREIYYSFTTRLVKTDFDGRLIGTVEGLSGHLGCIDFCPLDGRVYGSLEYKSDSIGRGIRQKLGKTEAPPDAFYCAVFSGRDICRPGMDARESGVMRAVFLPDPTDLYTDVSVVNGVPTPHRYGCSGIDGTGWGKAPGETADVLLIAAGIYGDISRADNDYQLLFRYNNALSWWDTLARPLDETAMHRAGAKADDTLFLYTGNTNWGVQNLEYDPFSGDWYLAVYPGKKPEFPNYSLFVLDGARKPEKALHKATGEPITEAFLKGAGSDHTVTGSRYPLGSTGLYAVGDGSFLVSHDASDPIRGQYTVVKRAEIRAEGLGPRAKGIEPRAKGIGPRE